MPRSRPPHTITLLLPSISASASAAAPGVSTHPSEHNLEVLLHAQKLASERGQYLDIMSFMTPAQRVQYLSESTRYRKLSSSQPLPLPVSSFSPAPSNPLPTLALPSTSQPTKRHLDEGRDRIPLLIDHVPSDSTGTPPPDSPHHPQPKKPRPLPDLSHLHWKQRQKRLAMIATSEIGEDSDLFFEKERESPGPSVTSSNHGRGKGEVDKEAVQKSASYWYAILCFGFNSPPRSTRRTILSWRLMPLIGTISLFKPGNLVAHNGTTIRSRTRSTVVQRNTTRTRRSLGPIIRCTSTTPR